MTLDDDEDVSIIYHHKKIKCNDNLYISYVKELLTNDGIEAKEIYRQILKYYKNSKLRYQPADIFEYIKIFYKIMYFNCIESTRINMDWVNSSEFIKVILKNGSEKPIFSYRKSENTADFIKIICPDGHEIIIYKNTESSENTYSWINDIGIYGRNFNNNQCINLNIGSLRKYEFPQLQLGDGYNNTYNNVNVDYDKISDFPALAYVNSLPVINGYKPYIPSIEELIFVLKYFPLMRYLAYRIGGSFLNNKVDKLLSSSEFAIFGNYCIINYDNVDINGKTDSGNVILLYKKISGSN